MKNVYIPTYIPLLLSSKYFWSLYKFFVVVEEIVSPEYVAVVVVVVTHPLGSLHAFGKLIVGVIVVLFVVLIVFVAVLVFVLVAVLVGAHPLGSLHELGKVILVELLFLGLLVFLNGILKSSSTITESAGAVIHLPFLTYAQVVASIGLVLLVESKETIPDLILPRFFSSPMFQTPKSILYQMAFLFEF